MKKMFLIFMFMGFVSMQAQEWVYDYDEALEQARAENKKIILVFSGSDWCVPCIKLERYIWTSPEFKAYAKEHYVMLRADFPRKKKNRLSPEQRRKNEALAAKYNPHGYFPLIVVLSPDGKVLGETGYDKNKTPADYIAYFDSL
ncbi:MAG: thioredoxin family protein [Chlorobi bacterium]|nr:thioredoxin family protein [Chlorobiota bacterium]